MRNNPLKYTDPSGHAASCDGCGGASLEITLEAFKKYGKHGDTFNNYYATVYFAEQSLAESLHDGVITNNELKILDAYDGAIKNEYTRASNWVSYDSLTESMLSPTFRPQLALRAVGKGVVIAGGIFLFRAVNMKEFNILSETGAFPQSPGGSIVKYFAESASDANKWGTLMEPWNGEYVVVRVELNTDIASFISRADYVDGIGPADVVPVSELNGNLIDWRLEK